MGHASRHSSTRPRARKPIRLLTQRRDRDRDPDPPLPSTASALSIPAVLLLQALTPPALPVPTVLSPPPPPPPTPLSAREDQVPSCRLLFTQSLTVKRRCTVRANLCGPCAHGTQHQHQHGTVRLSSVGRGTVVSMTATSTASLATACAPHAPSPSLAYPLRCAWPLAHHSFFHCVIFDSLLVCLLKKKKIEKKTLPVLVGVERRSRGFMGDRDHPGPGVTRGGRHALHIFPGPPVLVDDHISTFNNNQ